MPFAAFQKAFPLSQCWRCRLGFFECSRGDEREITISLFFFLIRSSVLFSRIKKSSCKSKSFLVSVNRFIRVYLMKICSLEFLFYIHIYITAEKYPDTWLFSTEYILIRKLRINQSAMVLSFIIIIATYNMLRISIVL